jgi:hypothetical protein
MTLSAPIYPLKFDGDARCVSTLEMKRIERMAQLAENALLDIRMRGRDRKSENV